MSKIKDVSFNFTGEVNFLKPDDILERLVELSNDNIKKSTDLIIYAKEIRETENIRFNYSTQKSIRILMGASIVIGLASLAFAILVFLIGEKILRL